MKQKIVVTTALVLFFPCLVFSMEKKMKQKIKNSEKNEFSWAQFHLQKQKELKEISEFVHPEQKRREERISEAMLTRKHIKFIIKQNLCTGAGYVLERFIIYKSVEIAARLNSDITHDKISERLMVKKAVLEKNCNNVPDSFINSVIFTGRILQNEAQKEFGSLTQLDNYKNFVSPNSDSPKQNRTFKFEDEGDAK